MADETLNKTVGAFYRQLEEDSLRAAIPNPAFYALLAFESPTNLLPEQLRLAAGDNRAEVTAAALAQYQYCLAQRPALACSAVVLVYARDSKSPRCPVLTIGPIDTDLEERVSDPSGRRV